jgi:uncharacterized membrane protein
VHDVRLLSVVAGAVLVTIVVRLTAEVAPLPLAALSGTLLAVGAQFTTHGRELRAYELFALLTAVFAIALHRAALSPSRGPLVAVGVVAAAGLMTHYFFAFTLVAGLAWLWLEPTVRAGRRRVTAALVAALAACSPWLPLFIDQYRHDRYSWIGPFDLRETLETPLRILSPLIATPATGVMFLAWLAAGAWIAWRRGPLERLVATLSLAPLVLAAATWAAGFNTFAIRNMIGIGPFVVVLALLPMTAFRAPHQLALATAVAVAAIGLFVVGQKPALPFNGIAAALVREGWRPPDSVVIQGGFYDFRSPLEWYLPHLPLLTRGRISEVGGHPAFAVLSRRGLPRRLVTRAARVGSYVVVRVRPHASVRWFRRGVVLTAMERSKPTT